MRRFALPAAFALPLLVACGPAPDPEPRTSPEDAARSGIYGDSIKALDAAKALEGQAEADSKRRQKAIDDAGG